MGCAQNLADAIQAALTDEVKHRANELGEKIRTERGADYAAKIIADSVS